MSWANAHAKAMIRASQAHHELGIDQSSYVDVYAAIAKADLILYGEEMTDLFGAYAPAGAHPGGSKAGIVVNSHRNGIDQRHTAAHELAHHMFGHPGCLIDSLDKFADLNPESWPPDDQEAEAFAAWFLMPSKAVRTVIGKLGITNLTTAEEVYQVSLHLGTSFRGTLRRMADLKQLPRPVAARWAKVPRAAVRARCAAPLPPNRSGEVWILDPAIDGATLYSAPGDRLVIRTASQLTCVPAGIRKITGDDLLAEGLLPLDQDAGGPLELEITPDFSQAATLLFSGTDGNWAATITNAPGLRPGYNVPA